MFGNIGALINYGFVRLNRHSMSKTPRITVLEALARQAETLRSAPDNAVAAEAAKFAAQFSNEIAKERGRMATAEAPRNGELALIGG